MNILTLKNKHVWFKCGVLKSRHGKVIDGLYDGLLLIMEDDTKRVFVASPEDIVDFTKIRDIEFKSLPSLPIFLELSENKDKYYYKSNND